MTTAFAMVGAILDLVDFEDVTCRQPNRLRVYVGPHKGLVKMFQMHSGSETLSQPWSAQSHKSAGSRTTGLLPTTIFVRGSLKGKLLNVINSNRNNFQTMALKI
jgi:hypothetical protein